MARFRNVRLGADRLSGVYLWALFIVGFGIAEPSIFLTTGTLHSVASGQAIAAMLAIAVLVPIIAGSYDLSVGATANLSAIVCVWLQNSHHWAMWPAIGASVVVGAVVGATNGFLVVKLHIDSFIATLGMGSVMAAFTAIVSGDNQPLPPTSQAWAELTQRQVFGFEIVVVYLIGMAVIAWWVLEHTPIGRYLYAIGGNADAARLAGIKVGKWRWLALTASGTIAGLAGVLFASENGPSLTFGSALLLPAFAAVFLGMTQITPGRLNVWGSMLAVYVLATGVTGLELLTGVAWLNDMFNGVALIAAVAFATWRQRTSGSRLRRDRSVARDAKQPRAP